jgi:zinc transport system ATP-binding protein
MSLRPPSDSSPLIRARHLSYRIGARLILDDIGFELLPGQITTVIGPNGAGKSSLIKIVIGLETRFEGELYRRPGLRMGYMPQQSQINPLTPLTVRRLMTLTRRAGSDEIRAALERTGVAALLERPVENLSGGELQRVMLARALLGAPDLLVLDEPTAGVDIRGEARLYELIAELRDEIGCAILMVSHDLHLVMSKTDQVLCLNRHLCCSGQPEQVSRHPEYLALFGDQASALAVYAHDHDHDHDVCSDCAHRHD